MPTAPFSPLPRTALPRSVQRVEIQPQVLGVLGEPVPDRGGLGGLQMSVGHRGSVGVGVDLFRQRRQQPNHIGPDESQSPRAMRSASALSSTSMLVAPRWMMPPPDRAALGESAHLSHQVVVNFGLNGLAPSQVELVLVGA